MRRTLILLLALAIFGLGLVLYTNVQESHLFRVTAPLAPQTPTAQSMVSGTSITSLTTVSATTLLENPRYTGQDAQNRRWEVTALNAAQQGTTASTTLVLQQVNANLEIPDKDTKQSKTITLKADQGTYQQAENQLHLAGNVQVEGQGLTLTAPNISTNLQSRHLIATGGVHAILVMPKKK